jgi:Uma2 family endonuclease
MGATTTQLMTFAEFEKLPDEVCRNSELRHGELIEMPPPKQVHTWLQQRIMRRLDRHAEPYGVVGMEIPFQPVPENEYYRVDVAFVSSKRWNANRSGYLQGSPEIVIEVLSPSNTFSEMNDRRRLFLETGCLEFWVVDIDQFQIDVSTPDGITTTYRRSQSIPLPLFGDAVISVDEIFQGLI